MQQVIGRVTANAKVAQLKDGREVTNFSIAINDSYKPKGSGEAKQLVTYIDCSYWITSKVAERIVKGSLVELNGRIGMRAWKSMDGEARGALTFHVNNLKIYGVTTSSTNTKTATKYAAPSSEESADDLPF